MKEGGMADENASMAEIVVMLARMDERLNAVEKRIDDLSSNMGLLIQQVGKRIDGLQGEVRSLRGWLVALHTPVVAGVVAALVKYLFF